MNQHNSKNHGSNSPRKKFGPLQKIFAQWTLILGLIVLTSACERDEICIDDITPQLIIRFYDQESPDDFKIPNLEVLIQGLTDTLRFTADSIVLPLNVNDSQTTFIMTTVEGTVRNSDTLRISYTVDDVFVGRACGYKSVFLNPVYERIQDTNNWILSFISTNELIENEANAHLNIFH